MEVTDCLASVAARVDHDAIARIRDPFRSCDFSREAHQTGKVDLIAGLVQRRHVLLRNNENVRRRLWVDVAEDDCVVGSRNGIGRYLTSDDPAKEAILRHSTFSR